MSDTVELSELAETTDSLTHLASNSIEPELLRSEIILNAT